MTETAIAIATEIEADFEKLFKGLGALQKELGVNDLSFVCLLSTAIGDIAGVHVLHGCCTKELFLINIQANFEQQFALHCGEQMEETAH